MTVSNNIFFVISIANISFATMSEIITQKVKEFVKIYSCHIII